MNPREKGKHKKSYEQRMEETLRKEAAEAGMPLKMLRDRLRTEAASLQSKIEKLAQRSKIDIDEALRLVSSEDYPTPYCIYPADLELLLAGEQLSADVEAHLRKCSGCHDLLNMLVPQDELVAKFRHLLPAHAVSAPRFADVSSDIRPNRR